MTNPIVSIIVPVYNVQDYIGACIDSILSQDFHDVELILIDDGSSDNSLLICEKYAKEDNRIIVVTQDNSGVSTARNKALDIAKGEWITFVDSDDWIDRNYLSTLVSYVKDGHHYDWITSGIIYKYSDNSEDVVKIRDIGAFNLRKERDFRVFVSQNFITSPCAKLYKSSIIRSHNLRFDKELNYGEDRDFNIQYIRYCETGFIADYAGYCYRKNIPLSLSTIKKGNILKGDIEYWNNLYDEFHRKGFGSLESNKYLIHRLYFFITDALALTKLSTGQISYLKTNINWHFLKSHIYLVKHDKICKALIMNKRLRLYSLYVCLKKLF